MGIFWDAKKITEDMDVLAYARDSKIPMRQCGKKWSILCPEHKENLGKEDKHFGSCLLNEKGYYCFACQAKGNGIKLNMCYFNHTFSEACEEIAEWLGDKSLYSSEMNATEYKAKETFPLSDEEINALGLLKSVTAVMPIAASVYKEDLKSQNSSFVTKSSLWFQYLGNDASFYIQSEESSESLISLFNENQEGFYDIVFGKSLEMIEKYRLILETDCSEFLFATKNIKKEFEKFISEQYQICKNIINRFGYVYQEEDPALKHQERISRFAL